MNMNMVADAMLDFLKTKHDRVYRNSSTSNPVFPYVVYRVENVTENEPSDEFYIHVDIHEDTNKSVRLMEDLADKIDGDGKDLEPSGLNKKVMNTDGFNAHFTREGRQFVDGNELISEQVIFLRYNTRIYFK